MTVGRLTRWVAVSAVGSVLGVGVVAHLDLRGDLDVKRTDLATAESYLRLTEVDLEGTRSYLAATSRRLQNTASTSARFATRVSDRQLDLGRRTEERDLADADLAATVESVRLTTLWRSAVSVSAWNGQLSINGIESCLSGVAAAYERRAGGDQAGTVGALASVDEVCAEAEAALTGEGGHATAFPFDFADPFLLRVGDVWYGYATNGGSGNIQLIRSADLVRWEWLGDALPGLPFWADSGRTWAPTVLQRGSQFLMYYSVRERQSAHQCISVAVGQSPAGPFVDQSWGPIICQHDLGGSIDPSVFIDADGSAWLAWKSEGETVGGRSVLWSSALSVDGYPVGAPVALVTADQSWEAKVVEGPSLARIDGSYVLFYSGNSWNSEYYGVGYAACDGPLGPCHKPRIGALIASYGTARGPGGPEVVRDGAGRLLFSFHAWSAPDIGYPNRRLLYLAPIGMDGGTPVLLAG